MRTFLPKQDEYTNIAFDVKARVNTRVKLWYRSVSIIPVTGFRITY